MPSETIKSLLGVAASLGLTATAPLFAMLPAWFGDVEKWGGVAAIFAGIFATLGIGVQAWLKNIKTGYEVADIQRKNLQEIQRKNDEQICLNRRLQGLCPKTHDHGHDTNRD